MDHNTCRENLSAFLDGELPPQERTSLEAHLAGCPECSGVLAELRSVSGIFKKNVMEPVPPSLKGEVLARSEKPSAYPWFKPVLALSTAAAGMLVVLNLNKTPEQAPVLQAPKSIAFMPKAEKSAPGRTSEAGGFSKDASRFNSALSGEGGHALPGEEAAAAATAGSSLDTFAEQAAKGSGIPAAAPEGGYLAADKKAERTLPSVAASRGSYGQAKYAAPRALGSLGGGASRNSAAGRSGAEFRGPVCVYVSSDKSRQEASAGLGEEGSDDFFWYLGKALIFLEKSGIPSPSAEPGRLVFIKKDGTRKIVTEKDCSLGFVFFDGVQDPLVVTDFIFITDQYNKYFGTSLEPIGDEIPD